MKILIPMMALMPLLLAAQQSNVTLPQDKGPDKIDVSAYPAPMQAAYKMFSTKCSKCHTIARPINTMMKRDEWERYVKRMMHKPNSGINDNQGKQIFAFLVHDQTERKDKNPTAFFRALSDEEIEKLKKQ
jgi:mono/diheme cytochrome c family protein